MQQMTVRELKERLAQPGAKPVLLDVREGWNSRSAPCPGRCTFPWVRSQRASRSSTRSRSWWWSATTAVRSQRVAYFLASRGFSKLYNLQGGVNAWARDIDPAMHTY